MTGRQLLILACFLAFAMVFASGCWSRTEIETLGFVMAFGLDKSPSGNLLLTVQFAKPEALSGSTESGGTLERPFWVAGVEGETVEECFRRLGETSPRLPYLAHNRFFIFGEELMREEGVTPVIDFIDRQTESRSASQVLVAKGTTARELLQSEFEGASMPSEGGQRILLYLTDVRGTVANTTLLEFEDRMEAEGIEPICAGVEIVPFRSDTSIEGELVREEVKSTARPGGAAIFKGPYLIGWLDDVETRGLNWITGKIKTTQVVFPQPGTADKRATVEITRATGKFEVEVRDGKIVATVKVVASGDLSGVQEPVDLTQNLDDWQALSKGIETAIEKEIRQTLSRLKELGSDAAGFGREIFRRNPKEWARIKDRWDELFPDMEVRVQVEVDLMSPGEVLNSVKNR